MKKIKPKKKPFNGAAFFQSGKFPKCCHTCWEYTPPSMEPLFFKAENASLQGQRPPNAIRPSMEPLFFKAENLEKHQKSMKKSLALQWSRFFSKRKITYSGRIVLEHKSDPSMEPLFFKAENSGLAQQLPSASATFNGAAFFQSGKSLPGLMIGLSSRGLQWSRFFSKRKIRGSGLALSDPRRLQWSRFFSKRKIASLRRDRKSESVLQWSRFFSKRKIVVLAIEVTGSNHASMEPLFFKAENVVLEIGRG